MRATETTCHGLVKFGRCNGNGGSDERNMAASVQVAEEPPVVQTWDYRGPRAKGPAACKVGSTIFVDDKIQNPGSVWNDPAGNAQDLMHCQGGTPILFASHKEWGDRLMDRRGPLADSEGFLVMAWDWRTVMQLLQPSLQMDVLAVYEDVRADMICVEGRGILLDFY